MLYSTTAAVPGLSMHTEYGQLSGSEGLKDPITESLHASHPAHVFFFFFMNS